MKAWFAVPAAAVAMTAALVMSPSELSATPDAASGQAQSVAMVVRVAVAEPATTMSDACVFSAEAMAAGSASQCGDARFIHVMLATDETPSVSADMPLEWPGDFFALTLGAAIDAWDATMCFVGSLFHYAGVAGGLDI